MQRNAITDNADHDTLDDECLLGEIDLYRLEFLVLRQQPDARTILPVALDGFTVLLDGESHTAGSSFSVLSQRFVGIRAPLHPLGAAALLLDVALLCLVVPPRPSGASALSVRQRISDSGH